MRNKSTIRCAVTMVVLVLFAICIGGLTTSALAEIQTLKVFADKDIFKDSTGVHNAWDKKMYIGRFLSPYGQSRVAIGFNLVDIPFDTVPIYSIKLVINKEFWSGSMNIVFTETEDDNWEDVMYGRFPSMTDPQEIIRTTMTSNGFYKSGDIQSFIFGNHTANDHYLSLIMSSDTTTENGSFYAKEATGKGAYLEVRYGLSAVDISTTSDQTETALNGMQLDLEVSDEAFAGTELTPDMFTLDSISQAGGVSISSVTYIDATHAQLTLAYTGDVDEHYDLAVTVSGAALSAGLPITSKTLAIHAYDEITQGGMYDLDDFGAFPDVKVYTTEPVILMQTSAAAKENCVIRNMVAGVDLTLAGVNINNDVSGSGAGIDFQGTGNTLKLTGENTIKTDSDPILRVTTGTALTIEGTGSLTAEVETTAAAIGSGGSEKLGDITINSGTIRATCIQDYGAGIGTGMNGFGIGTVTINGGTITAQGGLYGAGIGGGYDGNMTSVTINGGTITAQGGEYGAGIGSGLSGKIIDVTISGGTITARGGGPAGPGIGSGYGDESKVSTVTINGGRITAGYSGGGVGIGAGPHSTLGTINITGGVIDARWGGESDSAIGSDAFGIVDRIYISGGLIFADGYELFCDDIGFGQQNPQELDMDVRIAGSAVVFLRNNKLADRDDGIFVPFHDDETITNHQAYGFTLPDDWSGTAYAYVPSSFPVTGVHITPDSKRLNLSVTETCQVTAEVAPFYADNTSYTYSSSNTGVATVNASGLVTPVHPGTATITVKTDDGGFTDTCTVTVHIGLSGISLAQQQATLYLDAATAGADSVTLTPTFTPQDAQDKTIFYQSADTGIATVDTSGTVTAVSAGTVTITAMANDGGHTATCLVTVNQHATGVSVTPDTATLVLGDDNPANNTTQLSAVFTPSDTSDQTVTWETLSPGIITVDDSGLVTAQSVGSARVKLTTQDGGFTAEALITVDQSATNVSLDVHEAILVLGTGEPADAAITLNAIIEPPDATEVGLVWTSDNTLVATVDSAGAVTGVDLGTANVKVTTANGLHSDSCEVKVYQAATGIAVAPTATTLTLGDASTVNDTVTLLATVEPATAYQQVTWHSDKPDVASVDADGLVTAHKAGDAVFTATSVQGDFSASCTVQVVQTVTSLILSQTSAVLVLDDDDPTNDTLTLGVTVSPENASNKDVKFESTNAAVASVDSHGVITAHKAGATTIQVEALSGVGTAACDITVEQRVTGVSLALSSATLTLGDADTTNDTVSLTATISPADANNQAVTYTSSDPAVASVDASGIVTAVSAGSTTITVTTVDGGYTAVCTVTVQQHVTGLSVSPSSALLVMGDEDRENDTVSLTASIIPANADNQAIVWTSDTPAVATVDTAGVVTAVSKGKAIITATTADGGFTAACDITVEQRVTGVALAPSSATLVLDDADTTNDTVSLTATVSPADANNQGVTYTSSDPAVASVNASGTVTAVSAGSTTVTVTTDDGGYTAVCMVTVQQHVTGLSVSPSSALLVMGDEDTENDTVSLTATVLPDTADDQSVTFTSSDETIATVDATGLVTAHKKGIATITATAANGGWTATCDITVERRLMLQTGGRSGKVCLGRSITIVPSLGGGTWTYDPAFVSLQGNTFTPLRAGTTVVTYSLNKKKKGDTLLQSILALLFSSASAENVESVSFTITTEALTLTSSLSGGTADLHASFTLMPNFAGGSWSFDSNILERNGNTFTTKTTAKTTVTYTYQGETATYTLDVINLSPQTGDERPPLLWYMLLAGLAAWGGLYLRRLRKRHT